MGCYTGLLVVTCTLLACMPSIAEFCCIAAVIASVSLLVAAVVETRSVSLVDLGGGYIPR